MADGKTADSAVKASIGLEKFQHPDFTAEGEARAEVGFAGLETLWVNTGTLCNIECAHCYIASSPKNDRLVYLTAPELEPFLDEAEALGAEKIGFTGGEPFMNPDMIAMAEDALSRGFSILILTNAMRPMMRPTVQNGLTQLVSRFGTKLKLRISLDHYDAERHDEERGRGSFASSMDGMEWLDEIGASYSIAGRTIWAEQEPALRSGFSKLFAERRISLNANNSDDLILFPEMDGGDDVPEITNQCWRKLDVDPRGLMCASARMVVKRRNAPSPTVLACTLIAYDETFELGATVSASARPVKLNHRHCAKFCVLGGASCSG